MNIKSMLVRLQDAIGRDDLVEQMVLLWEQNAPFWEANQSGKSVNLIVGYNSSPKSHTALDISLLIAHQTRIATKVHVTVQAVYVVEENSGNDCLDGISTKAIANSGSNHQMPLYFPTNSKPRNTDTHVLTQTNKFAQAERILWQARCLAQEWQSYFKAHMRFGCIAEELKKVVVSEAATLLFLGCDSARHPLIQQLSYDFPCPVLGIPNCADNDSGC